MSAAIVFAWAVADGLTPVVGAAPFDVLARQLPRMLVARLNGGDDQGLRFFPFLGPVDDGRGFLRLRQLLEPAALLALHKQPDVTVVADGLLSQDRLVWRALDGETGDVRLQIEVPFDALDPLAVLPRLEFELTGLLGRSGHAGDELRLTGEGLGWYLVLKDDLLRREANLPDPSADPLRAARRAVDVTPHDPELQQLVLDYMALLLRRKQAQQAVAELAIQLAPAVTDASRLERLAGLTFAAGARERAVDLLVEAALLAPERTEVVERAAALAFQAGHDAKVEKVVGAARAAGVETPKMIAQLAASYDRSGNVAGRQGLVEELLGHGRLPVPVARLLVSFLLEESQPGLARTVLERALVEAPDQAMLHFELGRACLMLDDVARASLAFQRALELGLPPTIETQAMRFRRLSIVPGLWHATQLVERAIAAQDLGAACEAARALVRRAADVAETWLMYGIVLHKRGKVRRAERPLRRSLALDPAVAEAHNRLGVVLLQTARVAEGLGHLEKAHELAPADTSTLLHLAQAEALSGCHDEADRRLQQAAGLGADPELVAAVRAEIRSARNSA